MSRIFQTNYNISVLVIHQTCYIRFVHVGVASLCIKASLHCPPLVEGQLAQGMFEVLSGGEHKHS